MSDISAPKIFFYSDVEWDAQPGATTAGLPKEVLESAKKSGARRKRVVRGDGGFFMNRSVLPPGYEVPPHAHSHDELLVVLKGGCTISAGKTRLGPDDSIVIRADYEYGFTCGPEGMEFLTIRTGEASFSAAR